jgi:ribonuclease PH
MSRADRRAADEFREIFVQRGLSLGAQGSALLRLGATEVIATLAGPKECRIREIDTGRAQIRVKTFPEMHELNDIIGTALRSALDCAAYPDSTLDVGITILCDEGSLVCCAVNAAMLALADAGLKLVRDVAAACRALRGGQLVVDPAKSEEDGADGVVTFVYARDTGEVFGSFFEGLAEPALVIAALDRAACLPVL